MVDHNRLKYCVSRLEEEEIHAILDKFIASNPDLKETLELVGTIQQGVEVVGNRFEMGRYCAGDLIFTGMLLESVMEKLKPLLGKSRENVSRGLMILGTVEGDVHDIGKNILKSLAEISGYDVIDLGIDQPATVFVDAVKKHNPQILGLSGVLTIAIESMKKTIDALAKANLRDGIKVIVGGNAASEKVCNYVGADAWSKNAIEAIKIFESWR